MRFARALGIALTLGGACVAHADENALNDKLSISLGTFIITTDTTVRVDGSSLIGTPIDLKRDLGLADRNSFRLDGYWRFARKHKLRVMFFDEARSAQKTITRDITFQGQTYDLNTTLGARLDTQVAEVAYEYAFLKGDNYELAASAGVHDMSFKLTLSVVGNTINASTSARASVNGPLPVLGLHYVWQFTPQLNLDAMFQFFKLKVNPYDGDLEDYNLSLVYMPWKNFGVGAGWNEFVTHFGVDSSSYSGRLDWRYGGARLFARFSY
ncbi:MAG TPA: hypothetical protein VLW26_04080 [Steroidobacteraceae bacterium]|nr:hypothetical protein [Steroidobacteraceae bacterium]